LRKPATGSTIRGSPDEKARSPRTISQSKSALSAPGKIESQIQAGAAVADSPRKNHCDALTARNHMAKSDDLPGLTDKIATRLAIKPQVFIIHPAELKVLRSMTDQELRSLADKHGWRVVRRLGGRQIEFYNDAGTRAE
jgi:hypothetical protein